MSRMISVDFIQLEATVHKLIVLYSALEDELDALREAYKKICGMSLGEIEEELLYNIHRLEEELESIRFASRLLNRIIDVYRDCESTSVRIVDGLPFNTPGKLHNTVNGNIFVLPEAVEIRAFKANSVKNESWLEDIMDERQ